MPSFPDTAVLVLIALLLFGPKKLPVLARQLGKLMAEFRRASNEFRSQMEEELRIAEQADRQKQIAAIEAAAPRTPAIEASGTPTAAIEPPASSEQTDPYSHTYDESYSHSAMSESADSAESVGVIQDTPAPEAAPQPIATSGELSIMPPATGLPVPNSSHTSPPEADANPAPSHVSELEAETLHG